MYYHFYAEDHRYQQDNRFSEMEEYDTYDEAKERGRDLADLWGAGVKIFEHEDPVQIAHVEPRD